MRGAVMHLVEAWLKFLNKYGWFSRPNAFCAVFVLYTSFMGGKNAVIDGLLVAKRP